MSQLSIFYKINIIDLVQFKFNIPNQKFWKNLYIWSIIKNNNINCEF